MRVHELRRDGGNVVIRHEGNGQMLVLTPIGSCHQTAVCSVLDMAPAFGNLFDDQWRVATPREIEAHDWDQPRIAGFFSAPKPSLRAVP